MAGANLTHASGIYHGAAHYENIAKNRDGRRGVELTPVYWYRYGVLGTADADGVFAHASTLATGASVDFTITGALASASVATFDAPRNFTITLSATSDQSGVAVYVYGTDQFGQPLKETLTTLTGGTVQGVKAFLTVSRINATAAFLATQTTMGMGNIIGLPVRATRIDNILPMVDGNTVTAGAVTFVGGLTVTTAAAATGPDIRGTIYTSGVVPNASRSYAVQVLIPDNTTKEAVWGVAQPTT